ncbi:amidohydrolase family protein [Rhodococcus sp. T2V]|uniref:amidohydrolase family protein n=1 Tax=Rhodococcus sp. T2V TaxID=3034164 RepID=UPI0023E099AF|nr:amidohydrolase family protein [Rhodococcus sp. T2V]MDF3310571.1 amidohydrolase family protein [Rhodococcus sp. T2V]
MTDGQTTSVTPVTLSFSTDYRRIAVEEAWAPKQLLDLYRSELAAGNITDPGFRSLWGYYLGDTERASSLTERIVEAGPSRIAAMDAAGIDVQILSLTAPGVQVLAKDIAKPMAEDANDLLKQSVDAYPDRFSGLTAVAPQDPEHAAQEIRRGHDKLGFKGVIINSHTHGEYLDDKKFWPIFEAAESLDTPIYLHPTTPSAQMIQPYVEAGLDGAIFGFAADTGLHLLRIITSGVFDRFPNLKIVVGHLGEALPYWLWRIDFMHAIAVRTQRYSAIKPLELRPSDYLKRNIWYTSSGMPWAPALNFVRDVVGKDRVMFAWDYPYQYDAQEVADTDAIAWSPEEKKAFFEGTAERVFHL